MFTFSPPLLLRLEFAEPWEVNSVPDLDGSFACPPLPASQPALGPRTCHSAFRQFLGLGWRTPCIHCLWAPYSACQAPSAFLIPSASFLSGIPLYFWSLCSIYHALFSSAATDFFPLVYISWVVSVGFAFEEKERSLLRYLPVVLRSYVQVFSIIGDVQPLRVYFYCR